MEEISYQETHRVQGSHWWYQGRLQIIDAVLSKYLDKSAPLSVLEIGAGSGVNIGKLKEYGKVDAVEMHDGGRQLIRDEFPDVAVRDGALPEPEVFDNKQFDVVCMFDVLEHVGPQIESLEVLREHVTKDGRLFITVPAYQWLWSQHDDTAHHFRRYTRSSLAEALETAGWNVEQVGYFNTRLFPLALIARLKDKLFKPKIATGLGLPGDTVNGLFHRIFSSEATRVAKGGFPFGLSVLAVASPKDTASKASNKPAPEMAESNKMMTKEAM